jgi:hypothetical protein
MDPLLGEPHCQRNDYFSAPDFSAFLFFQSDDQQKLSVLLSLGTKNKAKKSRAKKIID